MLGSGEAMPRLRGRYTCVDVLGQGAMARTYKAVDEETGRVVAVKVLYPSRLTTLKEFVRFEREAETLARLNHRNIPRYIDHFEHKFNNERVYCLVQEHIDGPTLARRLEEGERFDEAKVVGLGIEALEVLAYLGRFEPAVVHRDLKPSNLVTGQDGALRLVDFGAVREAVRQTIQAGSTVIGTYGYMPPEQLTGEACPASDLFALGVTLVQCLTRRPASSLSRDGFTVDVEGLNLGVSPGLRAVLAGLVATRLEDRYGSAEEALADLRAVQAGEAPRFVDKLVRQRTKRERQARRQIQRRLSQGVTWFYRLVAFGAAVVFAGAVALIMAQARESVDAGLLVAGAVSGAGLLLALLLLGRRYMDEAWEPPPAHWRLTRGQVVTWQEIHGGYVEQGQESAGVPYRYTVERRGRDGEVVAREEHHASLNGPQAELLVRYPVGAAVTIRYNPEVPSDHAVEVER